MAQTDGKGTGGGMEYLTRTVNTIRPAAGRGGLNPLGETGIDRATVTRKPPTFAGRGNSDLKREPAAKRAQTSAQEIALSNGLKPDQKSRGTGAKR